MKKDINDLKKLVYGMLEKGEVPHSAVTEPVTSLVVRDQFAAPQPEFIQTNILPGEHRHPSIQETEAVIEESFSIEEKEKELIVKALEKNHGKRKSAAKDLGISERTLYRKLKEYDIEDF